MAARIAWLLNLDAERELQEPARYRPTQLSAERLAELLARTADLIAPEDLLLCDAERESATGLSGVTVLAFCPTPSALARIEALGLPPPIAPTWSVLREVNDRSFCAALGHGLEGAGFVRSMAQLEQLLTTPSPTSSYVIKRAFSFAGREQRRVHDAVLDDSTRGFCERSFARGEGLQVEPWVDRIADFSRHGYLTRSGELLLGAPREQRCDAMGRFLGMSTQPAALTQDEAAALEREVTKTGAALRAAGYFGPFGIDAFRYRQADGRVAFDPRCEINARFTMGYPRALLLQGLARDAETKSSRKTPAT